MTGMEGGGGRTKGRPQEGRHKVEGINKASQGGRPQVGIGAAANGDDGAAKEAGEEATSQQRRKVLGEARAQDEQAEHGHGGQVDDPATVLLADGRGDDGAEAQGPQKEGEAEQGGRVGDAEPFRYVFGTGCVDGGGKGPWRGGDLSASWGRGFVARDASQPAYTLMQRKAGMLVM